LTEDALNVTNELEGLVEAEDKVILVIGHSYGGMVCMYPYLLQYVNTNTLGRNKATASSMIPKKVSTMTSVKKNKRSTQQHS